MTSDMWLAHCELSK